MILARQTLKALIRQGRAEEAGLIRENDGTYYVIVDRMDGQRTDHYQATDADIKRLQEAE